MKMTYTEILEMFAVVRSGSMSFAAFVDKVSRLGVEAYEAGRHEGRDEGYAVGYADGKSECGLEAFKESDSKSGEAFDAVLGSNPNKKWEEETDSNTGTYEEGYRAGYNDGYCDAQDTYQD